MLDCQKLYRLMEQIGVKSFKELASITHIPYTTLNYMKTGHDMHVSTLFELAKFFGVPVDYLINSPYRVMAYTDDNNVKYDTTNLYEALVLSMM